MHNSSTLPDPEQRLLDFIGGQPLEGSGFETEQPDAAFVGTEVSQTIGAEE